MGMPIMLDWQYRVKNECRKGTVAYMVLGDGEIVQLTGVRRTDGNCEAGKCLLSLTSELEDSTVRLG